MLVSITNKMTYGYIYCFSNISMPGIYKIGMTIRTPNVRLDEANSSDTWRPPTPYKLEIAKKVFDPKQKESILHTILSQYTERINPKREFFRTSLQEVEKLFQLMDGELYFEDNNELTEEDNKDSTKCDDYDLYWHE